MSSNIFWWFWRLSVQCYQPICDVLLIRRLLWILEIFMNNILWKIFLPRNINNKCSDRKNNKFAFWAEASLWSTLVSCQLCENDLEPEKLSITSQQDSGSLTLNLQLFLREAPISSPSKCFTSMASSFLRQGLNQILSGYPSPFCIANFFVVENISD